jgi:hypothetical protein
VSGLGWKDAIVCAVIGFTACLAIIPVMTRPRRKGLPEPHADTRDWTGVFMKDVKRYGR